MRDQTIKADSGKPRISLVPTEIIRAIARVREYGVNKYGDREAWRMVEPERYLDAYARHTLSILENPCSRDMESGLTHIGHAVTNLGFMYELLIATGRDGK